MLAVFTQKTIPLCRSGQFQNQALGQAERLSERSAVGRGEGWEIKDQTRNVVVVSRKEKSTISYLRFSVFNS